MPEHEPQNVKITVIGKLDLREIHPNGGTGCKASLDPICPAFEIGDEFVTDGRHPDGFCNAAFVDIYRYISSLRRGANYSWMDVPGTAVACCTDGLRPVIFKIQRTDDQL